MRIFSYFFIVFLIIVGVSFAVLNAAPVTIHYYFGVNELPLSLLLILCFIFGVLLGLVMSLIVYLRYKRANARLRSRLKIVEEEVSNLRTMPVKDTH